MVSATRAELSQLPNGGSGATAAADIFRCAASYNSAAAFGGMGGAGRINSLNAFEDRPEDWGRAATVKVANHSDAASPFTITPVASRIRMLVRIGDAAGTVVANPANATATNNGGPAAYPATVTEAIQVAVRHPALLMVCSNVPQLRSAVATRWAVRNRRPPRQINLRRHGPRHSAWPALLAPEKRCRRNRRSGTGGKPPEPVGALGGFEAPTTCWF